MNCYCFRSLGILILLVSTRTYFHLKITRITDNNIIIRFPLASVRGSLFSSRETDFNVNFYEAVVELMEKLHSRDIESTFLDFMERKITEMAGGRSS